MPAFLNNLFYFVETKCILIWLFLILHVLFQHWTTTFPVSAGESVTLHCVQPAEVCVRRSTHLVPPYHPLLISYSLRCHVK